MEGAREVGRQPNLATAVQHLCLTSSPLTFSLLLPQKSSSLVMTGRQIWPRRGGGGEGLRGAVDLAEQSRRRSTGAADLAEERRRRSESGGSSRREAEEVRVVADLRRRGGVERIWRGTGEAEDGSREETRRRPDGRPGGEWRGLGLSHPAPAPSPLYMASRLGLAGYVGFVLAGRPTCQAGRPLNVPGRAGPRA